MDEIDDLRRRMQVSNLEAKLELLEIEGSALLCEITSSLTTQNRREQAFVKRDELAALGLSFSLAPWIRE
jgi:hypothetical protein